MASKFNFREAAKKATAISFLAAGREKGDINDIVNQPITIMGYDFADSRDKDTNEIVVNPATGEVQKYALIIIAEDDSHYYNTGSVISKNFVEIHEGYGGTTEEAYADLLAEGGIPCTINKSKSRSGNYYWSLTIR